MNTSTWNEEAWKDFTKKWKSDLFRMKRHQKIERIMNNSKQKAEQALALLAIDLSQQLQEIDDMELQIELKLIDIKGEKDPNKIDELNREIKVLLEWWKENTDMDYEI